jgi:ATP-dependent DNA ligase
MVRLECTTAGHNKFYEFHGIDRNGRFTVKGLYGAIGQAPKESIIYDGEDKNEANNTFQKKMQEKQKKGYVVVTRNGQAVTVPAEKKSTDVPVIWPMNAQGIKNEAHLDKLLADPAFIAQEKLDGMRAIIHVTVNGLRIFSRSAGVADPSRPLEKTTALPHLAALSFPGLIGTILDAEILLPNADSATLSGTVHRKAVQVENHQVKAFVFDILRYCNSDLMNKTYEQRLSILESAKLQLCSRYITVLPVSTTAKAKRALYDSVLASGGEGIILKRLDAFYIPGARPLDNWYKAKKSATFDCVIMGFTKGAGKYNDRIGAVRFGQYVNGVLKELGQASGMTDQIRKDMTEYPKSFIGKVITIRGLERLKSGAIRHPQYAGISLEKKAADCVWYEGEQ